jgi:hypothetical protein
MNELGGTAAALGTAWIFVVLFLVVLAILWFLLPFAIFGTKRRLDELIEEHKKTNTLLLEIVMEQKVRNEVAQNPKEQTKEQKGQHISFEHEKSN